MCHISGTADVNWTNSGGFAETAPLRAHTALLRLHQPHFVSPKSATTFTHVIQHLTRLIPSILFQRQIHTHVLQRGWRLFFRFSCFCFLSPQQLIHLSLSHPSPRGRAEVARVERVKFFISPNGARFLSRLAIDRCRTLLQQHRWAALASYSWVVIIYPDCVRLLT